MNDVLYGFDYFNYYFFLLYYKYVGFPLVARICIAVVMVCIVCYFFLAISIVYGIIRRRRDKRRYARLHKRYYESIKKISLNLDQMKEDEIGDILGIDKKKRLKAKDTRVVVQLLSDIESNYKDEINEINYEKVQDVFKISKFFEQEIQFGSINNKVRALKSIRSINGYVSEAVLVRLLYHRNIELRNSARFAYMWLSQNAPFRFFDEDVEMKLRKWDMAELHSILVHRQDLGYVTPNFLKWVNTSAEDHVKGFFVKEMNYFKETENCPALMELLNTRNWTLRDEIISTLGALKYNDVESKLIEMYDVQPEYIRQNIIKAISAIKSGNHAPFLKEAYENADDSTTKLLAISALYKYNEIGLQIFKVLEAEAEGFSKKLFAHVQHPLTSSSEIW